MTNPVCAILTDEKMTNTPILKCVSSNINLHPSKVQEQVLFMANGAELQDFHLPVPLGSVISHRMHLLKAIWQMISL